MALMAPMGYLKLEGIKGEAQDDQFEDQIEVLGYSFGASGGGGFASNTGGSTSKGQVHELVIQKYHCKASLELWLRCLNQDHIPSGKLTLFKLSGETKIPYKEYEFTDMMVNHHSSSGSCAAGPGGSAVIQDSLSFSFAQVKMYYTPQADSGSAEGKIDKGWHVQKNIAV
jgi:type VI secretion system secreted protein Hcp